jgi:hypothetical protein
LIIAAKQVSNQVESIMSHPIIKEVFKQVNLDDLTNEESFVLENTLETLRKFVSYSQAAKRRRLTGDIPAAQTFQARAEECYYMLPEYLKW